MWKKFGVWLLRNVINAVIAETQKSQAVGIKKG